MNPPASPKLSVAMSVNGDAPYLKEAIESILTQSFRDFEFLIVNDGASFGAEKTLNHYANSDARVEIITNESNLGLAASLNKIIKRSSSRYLVRMDADDVAKPDRLERQYEFMEENPEIGVSGSWVEMMGDKSKIGKFPDLLKEPENMLFWNCFCHPSVIIRKRILEDQDLMYSENTSYGQDYELWMNLYGKTRFQNLPEVLLKYRYRSLIEVDEYKAKQTETFRRIQLKGFKEHFGMAFSEKESKSFVLVDVDNVELLRKAKVVERIFRKSQSSFSGLYGFRQFLAYYDHLFRGYLSAKNPLFAFLACVELSFMKDYKLYLVASVKSLFGSKEEAPSV